MKMILTKRRPMACKFILLSILVVLILSSIAPVYANPDNNDAEAGGWIEAVCTVVPEGFEGSVSVMVSDIETDEVYTIDCLKANGFLGRMKLPYGKYFVDRIYTSDTFYYEGFTDLYSFELNKEMSAAQKIEIEVIRNNVPDDVFEMKQEEVLTEEISAEAPSVSENAADEQSEEHKEEKTPSLLIEETDEEGSESSNEEPATDVNSDEGNSAVKKALRNIGISLLATVAFVGIVGLFVYLIRSRYYEEE